MTSPALVRRLWLASSPLPIRPAAGPVRRLAHADVSGQRHDGERTAQAGQLLERAPHGDARHTELLRALLLQPTLSAKDVAASIGSRLAKAAVDIIKGASYDNNLLCIGEKQVFEISFTIFLVERVSFQFQSIATKNLIKLSRCNNNDAILLCLLNSAIFSLIL
mgnify:CR=1 FL=1